MNITNVMSFVVGMSDYEEGKISIRRVSLEEVRSLSVGAKSAVNNAEVARVFTDLLGAPVRCDPPPVLMDEKGTVLSTRAVLLADGVSYLQGEYTPSTGTVKWKVITFEGS